MHSMVCACVVCILSVCHMLLLFQNGLTVQAVFLAQRPQSANPTLFGDLQKFITVLWYLIPKCQFWLFCHTTYCVFVSLVWLLNLWHQALVIFTMTWSVVWSVTTEYLVLPWSLKGSSLQIINLLYWLMLLNSINPSFYFQYWFWFSAYGN